MTARLMTPFCFASLLAAALIAEGALAPYIAADTDRVQPAAGEAATYADIYRLELLHDEA
ncbi:hypothetical protein [Hyphomonas sp.]|uniref:hypothetical protein n=1 Tax=Hyphomonas sp. TaxID=87 RepID=UPI0025BF73A7|nr:hypothetical protein [Hyphomonas sp.]MBA4340138.1 hypothetical protein [Hyphomonas sp.]